MRLRGIAGLAALVMLSAIALAHSYKAAEIAIGHVWALPSVNGETQVFFPMSNRGAVADALIAARADRCSGAEFRRNYRYDDPALDRIEITAGKPVPMRPKALHLRLLGCRKPLVAGDRIPLILDFLNAGEASVEVSVESGQGH